MKKSMKTEGTFLFDRYILLEDGAWREISFPVHMDKEAIAGRLSAMKGKVMVQTMSASPDGDAVPLTPLLEYHETIQ